jgi:UDP-3-O-[3-hydroxymyristoyl] N-acetylglucosamine deacetylase / 3-hydroxyacyl-[acyl-carrier-protein] dehydratase
LSLQKTIKTEATVSGRGLFSGKDAKVVFRPAPPDYGIVFVRVDLPQPVQINALATNVDQQSRRTTIKNGTVTIDTIEHCLAAINALGIDNLIIEVNAPELPDPTCSSEEFYKALKNAGYTEQQADRKEFVITEPITLTTPDASIYALPYPDEGLNIIYDLDYTGHTGIGRQIYSCKLTPEGFEKNLAPARTFLLEAEAKQFQARGIGSHLGPRQILVISSDGPIKNKFIFPNECVRHKIVDLIGDLALVGRVIRGRIVAYKSGHALNHELARKLYDAAVAADRTRKTGSDAVLDIRQISRILPHRYPFLMVDKVIEIEGQTRIKGIKNVTYNEQFFQGHFPGTPVMPGVLIIEAMAQMAGLLFAQTLEHTGKLALLLSMDSVKLRKAVVPGDQLILIAEAVKVRQRSAECRCQAMVGTALVAEADIRFMLVDDERL